MKPTNARKSIAHAAGTALALAALATMLPATRVQAGKTTPAGLAAQKSKDKKQSLRPGPLVEESGTFAIQVDGQAAGTEEFEIRSSGGEWTARGKTEMPAGNGASSKVTGKLELGPDGAPLRYEWTATNPRKAAATIVFDGTLAKMELRLEGAAPYTQEFSFQAPPVVILDNNMYHQYAILAHLYDWEHKEPKTFSVLIPQDLTPGSVTVEYTGPQMVDGQKLEALRVRSADLEIELYCEPEPGGRLVRLEVPAAKAVILRQPAKK